MVRNNARDEYGRWKEYTEINVEDVAPEAVLGHIVTTLQDQITQHLQEIEEDGEDYCEPPCFALMPERIVVSGYLQVSAYVPYTERELEARAKRKISAARAATVRAERKAEKERVAAEKAKARELATIERLAAKHGVKVINNG